MSPRSMSEPLVRETALLRADDGVGWAVEVLLASRLPALPVVDGDDRLVGIFGEREFVSALFPAYLRELKYAGFVGRALDEALEKRASRDEPVSDHMNTEHVDVRTDFSDAQVAETFLHHRVLILPVCDERRAVTGVITRHDFFEILAARFLV